MTYSKLTVKTSLIPTAEVPLTNLVRGKILEADALPLKYTATPCFAQGCSCGRYERNDQATSIRKS